MATVRAPQHPDRRFSMFRITRYDPSKLSQCLQELGWDELDAQSYVGDYSLRLYRKRLASVQTSELKATRMLG